MNGRFLPATAGKVPGSGFLVQNRGRGDLWVAAGFALGLHALLFVALPVALILTPAQAGQNPGVTSLEIALSAPTSFAEASKVSKAEERRRPAAAPGPSAPTPEPEPVLSEPEEPAVEPEPAAAPIPMPTPTPNPEPRTLNPEPKPAPQSPLLNQEPGTRNQEPQAPSVSSSGAQAATWSHHNIRYPEKALKEGRTGKLTVRVEVLASGRAGKVELVESSGHPDLDEAAVNGLRTAWFRPATDGRKAVASVQLFPASFEIVNGRAKIQ